MIAAWMAEYEPALGGGRIDHEIWARTRTRTSSGLHSQRRLQPSSPHVKLIPELADMHTADDAVITTLSHADSAFGLLDNEMTQSIIAAINPRWNMASYA